MSTSSGRDLAQAIINAIRQYEGRNPSGQEVIKLVNKVLPPQNRYTKQGGNNLLNWLTGLIK